jgi:hypothetical protein
MLLLLPGLCGRPDLPAGEYPAPDTESPACVKPDTTRQGGVSPIYKLKNYEIARLSIGQPPLDSISKWLGFVGLPDGNPFCAAAQCVWNEYAGVWHPRSGLARHFITRSEPHRRIPASKVLRGEVVIPVGSIVVYERGNTIYGHVGAVTEDWTGPDGMYISANTSAPGSGGSEFAGGGVWEKAASIRPGAAFRITTFIIIEP